MIDWVIISQTYGSTTSAMKVPGGVVLRVTSYTGGNYGYGSPCGGTVAESICFIPGAGIIKESGKYELFLP